MAKRARSYAWALRFSTADPRLSPRGRVGLEIAQELARNAAIRKADALFERTELPTRPALSVADHMNIKQARIDLFGKNLSDRAIRYRLQHPGLLRSPRACAEPGCDTSLPPAAHPNRRYCDEHGAPAARTARSRRR